MALIRCPECGKEISDQAYACINCGCPVSKMKTRPASTQESRPTASSGARPTTQVKRVPTEIPEMKVLPGIILQLVQKLDGMVGLAGFMCLCLSVANLLDGDFHSPELLPLGILGLLAAMVLANISISMQAAHVKRYLRKNGYEPYIRNDDASWTNAINAFKLYPSMPMAKYIRKLHPDAGDALIHAIQKNQAAKRKERLARVPYFLLLGAIYYLLPRFEWVLGLPYESSLVISHIVTLVVMLFFGRKKDGSMGILVAVAAMFSPVIFAYYDSDMWYHIAICAAAAYIGLFIGVRVRKN